MSRSLATLCVASATVLVGLAAPCADALEVWVSILPQQEIVRRIAADHVDVRVLVKPGHSPATYEPTPRQMAGLEGADLLIRIGAPFETSLLRRIEALVPELEVVDGRRGIDLLPMAATSPTESSADHGDHHHGPGVPDPHFWLDPLLVKVHAATVCEALCERAPRHAAGFRSRLAAFHAELEEVHQRITVRLAPFAGRELFVFHPAYGYFARRYGLRQMAVEAGGKEPTGRQLARLIDIAREAGVRSIFVQPQFSGGAARAVADALGAELVELDPLAADSLSNLDRRADRIAAALVE